MSESELGAQAKSNRIVAQGRRRRRSAKEPLEIRLSVRFVFGPQPEDTVVMIDDRAIPMVGSVFQARDAIAQAFALLLVKASVSSPHVLREIFPLLRRMRSWPMTASGGRNP
jgi:hypothetical protein